MLKGSGGDGGGGGGDGGGGGGGGGGGSDGGGLVPYRRGEHWWLQAGVLNWGIYIAQVKRWLEFLPRHQIFIGKVH